MTRYFQFRAFIGPEYLPVTDAANFPYYSGGHMPALDATIDLDYSTTLAVPLASGAVTCVTTDVPAFYNRFPTVGGLWLAPNGAGEGWEHVTYTGRTTYTFTGLGRESTAAREHNGVHSFNAMVRFWYPIETDTGVLSFTEQLAPEFSARFWRMDLSGFALPPTLLRNDYMVAICYRTLPSGAWKYFSLGISDSVKIKDDFERKGEWSLHVDSIHGRCENSMIHGVHVGDLDIARNGQALGSAPLGSAFKDLLSGDYNGSNPDFSADSIIDGEPDTLFISDYMTGTAIPIDATWDAPTQLYINPHPGRGPAYKWVELTNFSTVAANLHVYDPATGLDYPLDIEDFSVPEGDYRVILTDDPVTFARENPAYPVDYVVDVGDSSLGWAFIKHCNPLGGAMAIAEATGKTHIIIWGNAVQATVDALWGLSPSQWVGPNIAAPGYGQTIAFRHNYTLAGGENSRNKWELRNYGHPGYMPRLDRPEFCWVAVYLPGLGLVLRDDIIAGLTTIYLVDASEEPSTEGLPSAGTIQIGAEQITYTGKLADRLTGTTITQSHSSGDIVQVVENGIATDGYPIKQYLLRRFGGTIYLKDFHIRWSRVLARLPTQSDHENDYVAPYGGGLHATTGSTADFLITLDDIGDFSMRCRTVLVEFRLMTTDPSFGKLNELRAIVDTNMFNSSYYVPSPANAGEVLFKFLTLAGLPPGAISYTAVTLLLDRSFRSAREWAWKLITDFADMNGLFVSITRDARVVVTPNPFYASASHTPDYSWDEDDVVYVDKVTRAWEGVGQIRIEWEAPNGETDGKAVYPALVSERGGIEDIGPYTFADQAAAELAARERYYLKRVPFYVVIELVDIDLAIRAGHIFRLSWQFPGETVPLNRLYIVAGVDLRIMEERAVMVLTGLQIDREANW